jgi:glycosyltransferase involved in cell wall biosynthesis
MTPAVMTVVICAYTCDRWEQLQAAVQSVLEQEHPAAEIVVVIDYCPKLEAMATETFGPHGVRVIRNAARRGLSGARNTGTSRATGDVLVFLDDDAVAQSGWLAAHARHHDDPDVIGVGGPVTPLWEDAAPSWFPPEFGWVVGCSYVGQPTATAEIRNPIGANMSFQRSVLEAVGGFSQSLGRVGTTPRGCEETELAIRATSAFPDGRILFEPDAVVRHHVPISRTSWSYFRRRCWFEGLSKAGVTRLSDSRRALATERTYVTRTLPTAVRRNIAEAGRELESAPVLRAAAICAGLAITTAGYATAQVRRPRRSLTSPVAAVTAGGAAG